MNESIKNDYRIAVGSRINMPVVAYFEAKLADVIEQLIVSPADKLEKLQGRAQELKELIQLTKSVRE